MNAKTCMICTMTVMLYIMPTLSISQNAKASEALNLPQEIQTYLSKNLPDWKVVQLSDLLSEDKEWWIKQHSKNSPGFTAEHFEPTNALAFAVALIPKDSKDHRTKLLVFSKTRQGYAPQTLLKLPNANPPVVFQMPPGVYKSWDMRREIKTNRPAIFYVHYEASTTMFYWSKGKYRKLQVLD